MRCLWEERRGPTWGGGGTCMAEVLWCCVGGGLDGGFT